MNESANALREHLDRVLRQWRMTIVLQGLAVIAASGVALIGLSMFLDFMIGLNTVARTVLLILCFGGVVAATVFSLIRPLRLIPDDLQIARYVEEQHPELNDGFVSVVEFRDQDMDGTARVFLDRLIAQVNAQSSKIDFSRVIDRRRLYQAEGMAFVAIVLLALFAIQDVDLFTRSATRITAPWTRPGPLLSTELEVNPGDTRIPRGSNQVVDVKLLGKLVPSVQLMSRLRDQDEWYPVEMFETETTGSFTYELSTVSDNTEYYIDASPATSSTFEITVYDPPRVEQIDITYTYPAYSGMASRTEEDKGDITAPVGTTVSLAIEANKAIDSAMLSFSNDHEIDLAVDGTSMSGSFRVTEDLSYTVYLIDTDDLTNENPVEYYVRALPDNAPRVTITKPGRDSQLSPIDEMTIRMEAEDDFGLSSFKLVYSVNGGNAITIDLATEQNRKSRTAWDGEHFLYLEELSVVPGDFISYYAETSDRRGEDGTAKTDMYFTTIRPFEEIYRQKQGGAGGGGGGIAGLQPGKQSQDQKEIIAATWRVNSTRKHASEAQTCDDLNAVADAQEALRVRVQEAVDVLLFQGAMDPEMQEMSNLLQQSQEPMDRAVEELRSERSAEALIPEREALHFLLKVDALIREYMITQQNSQSQSSAPLDMSDTSELELKRDENKYETLDQTSQSQQQQQESVDESLQRVKELARRQQQLNEQMRDLANQDQKSETEKQRELDRLTREQRDLRQQAEEMSRQLSEMSRQQQNSSQYSQQQSQRSQQSLQQASSNLRESSDEMGQSAQQLQRSNPQDAAGQGSRALQSLEDSSQQLARVQGRSLEGMVRDAVRRADQLASQQDQLARAVGELRKEEERDFSGIRSRVDALNDGKGSLSESDKNRQVEQFVRRRLSDIGEAKQQTSAELQRIKEDLEFLSGQASADQPQSADALRQAVRDIENQDLAQKLDRSKRLLQPNSLERSEKTERNLAQELQELADQIRSAQDQYVVPDRDQLAREQSETREAMSEFQDLQRQLNRMQRRSPLPGQEETLSQQYQERLQDMQNLSGRLPQNSQQSQNLNQQLNRAAALGDEPWKIDRAEWDELRQDISRALIDVHRDLGNRMDGVVEREKLFMTREEEVPPQYRDLVNRYYESLSRESEEQ